MLSVMQLLITNDYVHLPELRIVCGELRVKQEVPLQSTTFEEHLVMKKTQKVIALKLPIALKSIWHKKKEKRTDGYKVEDSFFACHRSDTGIPNHIF